MRGMETKARKFSIPLFMQIFHVGYSNWFQLYICEYCEPPAQADGFKPRTGLICASSGFWVLASSGLQQIFFLKFLSKKTVSRDLWFFYLNK
jgi:hypothetical protein